MNQFYQTDARRVKSDTLLALYSSEHPVFPDLPCKKIGMPTGCIMFIIYLKFGAQTARAKGGEN